jgi:hypothetical protein
MDFLALSCYVSIRSQFHVVISLGFIREKRCSVRLYLQLFVGELMSYSRYLCLFAYSGVQRILCSGFFLGGGVSSCVSYVASFSGLSIFYCPFGIL